MEYLEYGNLQRVITLLGKQLPNPVVQKMMYDVADGLAYLHNLHKDERIVHGDIKPQNILVGEMLVCKISDFGGSVLREHTGLTPVDAEKDAISVTQAYCAPEFLSNPKQKARTSMDVFSYGKVIQNCNPNEITNLKAISNRAVDSDPKKRPRMLDIKDELKNITKSVLLNDISQIVHVLEGQPEVDLNSVSDNDKLRLDECSDKDFESRMEDYGCLQSKTVS